MDNVFKTFIGDHGTTSERCKKIKREGFNKSHWGWLGAGIYFFEEDKELARSWAKIKYGLKPLEVLEFTITVERENILDISDPKSELTKKVNQFREIFLRSGLNKNKIIDMEDEKFDGKLLDMICDKDGYVLVRNFTHTSTENDRINNKKRSNIANGVELCVKDDKYIIIK
ncbi:hypothetical protein FDF26_12820 [Clostridium botulinum]|nr:hypothetical protein [Clostridium botulinum]